MKCQKAVVLLVRSGRRQTTWILPSAATSGLRQCKYWFRSTLPITHSVINSQLTNRVSLPWAVAWSELECWHIAPFNLLKYLLPQSHQWASLTKPSVLELQISLSSQDSVGSGSPALALETICWFQWFIRHSVMASLKRQLGLLPLESVAGERGNVDNSSSQKYLHPFLFLTYFQVTSRNSNVFRPLQNYGRLCRWHKVEVTQCEKF